MTSSTSSTVAGYDLFLSYNSADHSFLEDICHRTKEKNPKKKVKGVMKDNPPCTGLVLQGGGALGAYEYGAIKALYEQRPGFAPTVITGLSIGSVNAAILAGAADPLPTFPSCSWCWLPTGLEQLQSMHPMLHPRLDSERAKRHL